MTTKAFVPTVNVSKRATVYTVTRPVVASGSMLRLLQPGCRLHIWSSRHSSLGGYIATVRECRHDSYLGEYTSPSMPGLTLHQDYLTEAEPTQL